MSGLGSFARLLIGLVAFALSPLVWLCWWYVCAKNPTGHSTRAAFLWIPLSITVLLAVVVSV